MSLVPPDVGINAPDSTNKISSNACNSDLALLDKSTWLTSASGFVESSSDK
jgi:hypothetical protein